MSAVGLESSPGEFHPKGREGASQLERPVGGELVFQGVSHDKINGLPIVVRLFANLKHGRREVNRTLGKCRKFAGISADPL